MRSRQSADPSRGNAYEHLARSPRTTLTPSPADDDAFLVTTIRRAWDRVCLVAMVVLIPYWAVKLIGSLADTAWTHAAIYAFVLAALAVITLTAREAQEQPIAHEACDATTREGSPTGSRTSTQSRWWFSAPCSMTPDRGASASSKPRTRTSSAPSPQATR